VVVSASWRGNGTWEDVRIALGSVAATPVRITEAEAALEGSPRTLASVDAAVDALAAAIHPIDDVRSTASYRREAARRVVHRLLSEAVSA
jgi:CO/xanthine dehydrogenase FAD-binding subunit